MMKFTQTVFANQSRFLGLLSPKSFRGVGFKGRGESKLLSLCAFFAILSWRQERMNKDAYAKICLYNKSFYSSLPPSLPSANPPPSSNGGFYIEILIFKHHVFFVIKQKLPETCSDSLFLFYY